MDEMRRVMMETKRKRAQDNRGKIAGANTTGCDLESRVVELTKSDRRRRRCRSGGWNHGEPAH